MPETPSNTTGQNHGNDDRGFRFNLAKNTIYFVFGVVGVLGLAAILVAAIPTIILVRAGTATADDIRDGFTNVKDILGVLLPVMSAWAGTVLAFYFTRENFESAARSTASLVRQLSPEEKLKSILIRDAMIRIEDADTLILEKEPSEIKLKDDIIKGILDKKNRNRLPILDQARLIKYMAHRSLFDKFIADKAGAGADVSKLTLANMLEEQEFKEMLIGSYRTVQETSNLADAKAFMDKIKICSDVFATEDGQPTTKVIGWITDVIVREQATV
jgi:hypothetical protein